MAQSMRKTRVGRMVGGLALSKATQHSRAELKTERQLSTPPKRKEQKTYQTVILEQRSRARGVIKQSALHRLRASRRRIVGDLGRRVLVRRARRRDDAVRLERRRRLASQRRPDITSDAVVP